MKRSTLVLGACLASVSRIAAAGTAVVEKKLQLDLPAGWVESMPVAAPKIANMVLFAQDTSWSGAFKPNLNVIAGKWMSPPGAKEKREASVMANKMFRDLFGMSAAVEHAALTTVAGKPTLRFDARYKILGVPVRATQLHIFGDRHHYTVTYSLPERGSAQMQSGVEHSIASIRLLEPPPRWYERNTLWLYAACGAGLASLFLVIRHLRRPA